MPATPWTRPRRLSPRPLGAWGALGAGAFLLLFLVAPAGAQLDYARDPDTVVVSLREILGEIGEADQGPSLRIHGDGRAVVHYPRYMQRAGDWETRLSAAEMDRLLAVLVDDGLLAFDAEAVTRELRAADAARAAAAVAGGRPRTAQIVLDASTIVLELRVNGVEKSIRWSAAAADAARAPSVAAVQGLAAAERELRALMERADLTRMP